MENIDIIETTVNIIKEEDDCQKKSEMLAELFLVIKRQDREKHERIFQEMQQDREKINSELQELRVAILGNGGSGKNVENSIIHRLIKLEKDFRRNFKVIWGVGIFIATAIGGWFIASFLELI